MRWNLGLAGLASSWGLVAVLASSVTVAAAPLAFLRLALAAATLAVVSLLRGGPRQLLPGRHLGALATLGVVQALHWWLFFETVHRGSVALAVLTFFMAPLFLAVLAPVFLTEKLSNVALGALVPGGIGIALVVLAGEGGASFGWLAFSCGMGSALLFAVLVILSKRLLRARVRPLTVALWDCLVGALVLSPALFLVEPRVPAGPGEWAAVLLLGVCLTALSTLAYTSLLRHVTAQAAGIMTFLEPVTAVLLAWVLLDESLSGRALLGGLLVVLAGLAVVALEPEERVSEAVAGVGSPAE